MGFYSATDFEPDCSVGYLARRIHLLSASGLEPVFAAEGLTNIQWHALTSIFFGKGATPAGLARDLAYDKGATTRLLDALEARGWVTRERPQDDRRSVRLSLTRDGEEIARHVRLKLVETWNGWLADWPHEDVTAAITMLQRIRDTLVEKAQ